MLCAAIVLSWQALTVRSNYVGNWSALFCTGTTFRVPPALAREKIYRFNQSNGWDGQFYHYIAHDPFLHSDLKNYIDAPRLRYRRILIPLLARNVRAEKERGKTLLLASDLDYVNVRTGRLLNSGGVRASLDGQGLK